MDLNEIQSTVWDAPMSASGRRRDVVMEVKSEGGKNSAHAETCSAIRHEEMRHEKEAFG